MKFWKTCYKPLRNPGILWPCLAVVLGVVGFIVAQPLTVKYPAAQEVRVIPFTLKLEGYDYQFWPEGRLYLRKTVARRSDGAIVDAAITGVSDKSIDMRKVALVDGEVFTVANKSFAYAKWPSISDEQMAASKERLRHPPNDCIFTQKQKVVGHATILGRQVIVISNSVAAGERTLISRAPDLACEALEVRIEQQQADGSWTLKSETKAVSLTLAEPDPSLFEVPSTYTSMKPSDMMRKEYARIGAPWDQKAERSANYADAQYFGLLSRKR